jgi:hypothetical protein
MVRFSHRYDRAFYIACSRFPGCWILAQRILYPLLLPLLTTTHIGGGPAECEQLARDWSFDETAHLCWECALVRLGIKEEEGSGMKVPITPSHNV